jgi:CheY-like chemotaxis protein
MQQPRLRRHSVLSCKKVLLIDRCQATCEVRASVLRSHGVEVHVAADLSGARFLWHPNVYQLIMLDTRRYSPGDALEFCQQIRDASPHERIAFLVGPPTYLSFTWPNESSGVASQTQQRRETVNRFLAAA